MIILADTLQVLAPGEVAEAGNIANRGRMTGAGYYPVKHTAGAAFTITVNSCDDNYNIVNDTPIVKIITDDLYDTEPSTRALVNGTTTFSVTLITKKPTIIMATTDYCPAYKSDYTQSIFVTTNTPYMIQVIVPGETPVEGKITGTQPGKTEDSTPSLQYTNSPFKLTVRCVDQYYNKTDEDPAVSLTSDGLFSTSGDPNDPQGNGITVWLSNGQYTLDNTEKWVFKTVSSGTGSGWQIRIKGYPETPNTQWNDIEYSVLGYPQDLGPNSAPSPNIPVDSFDFSGSVTSTGSISWDWTDKFSNEQGFAVKNNSGINVVTGLQPNILEWDENNLSANTRYTRYVVAYSSVSTDILSNMSTFYTFANPPTDLRVNGYSGSEISLSWTEGIGGDTSYAIERSSDGPNSGYLWLKTWSDNYLSESFIDSTLNSNTTYWYRIYGYNGDGIITASTGPVSTLSTSSPPDRLQLLVPGETAQPYTGQGKSGTPNTRFTAGQSITITVSAADSNWNIVPTASPTVHIESTDQYGTRTDTLTVINGSTTTAVNIYHGEMGLTGYATHYIKTYPISSINYLGNNIWLSTGTSPEIKIYPNLVSQYQILVPNQRPVPGKPPYGSYAGQPPVGDGSGGKGYEVSFQTSSIVFSATVRATDNYYNLCTTASIGGVTVTVTDPSSGYSRAQGLSSGQNTWNDVRMVTASTWLVRVMGNLGSNYYSSAITVLPVPPIATTSFSGTAQSTGSIRWTWIDNANNEQGYAVKNQSDINLVTGLPINTQEWIEGDLYPNTRYTRYSAVYNSSGTTNSNIVSSYTLTSPPGSINIVDRSSSTISLNWTNPALSTAAQFGLYRSSDNQNTWQWAKQWPSGILWGTTGYTDNTLQYGTTYYYRIYGYNGDGIINNDYSGPVSTATLQPPPSPPIPHNLAFITESRRIIAGTTIQFDGSGALGTVIGTTTVDGYNPFAGINLPMPVTLYSNRVQTITVITVQLRDQSDNPTTSTSSINIRYSCVNSTTAHCGEDPTKGLMSQTDWPNITGSNYYPAIITPGSSEHSFFFFDTRAGTSTLKAEGTLGGTTLAFATQDQYITAAPARFFTLHHNYPVTSPLPVNTAGSITVKAHDRYGNISAGDGTNGQYYKGMVRFANNGSSTTVTQRAMPGSATYYVFADNDRGVWQGMQVINTIQGTLKISATHYASPAIQALDYPDENKVFGYTSDETRTERSNSDGNLWTAGVTVIPILSPDTLLSKTNYIGRHVTQKIYQGDGNTSDNFQPFPLMGLTMVTLPEEANLTTRIDQIKVEKVGTMPSRDVDKMILYYDATPANYYFDPELTWGGVPTDTKLQEATYDSGTDAWYFNNLSSLNQSLVNKSPRTYFIAIRLSTSATSGTYFGTRIVSYQSITTTDSVTVASNNFEMRSSTWAVERTPPKVYAELTDIAAWYQLENTSFTGKYPYMYQGDADIGILKVAVWAPMFQGIISGFHVERTGIGNDIDLAGVKIYMDGKDISPVDGIVDAGSNPNGTLEPGGDMELTGWLPFSDYNANCQFSRAQLLDYTTRYFFVTYKIEDSASAGTIHGARIVSIDLSEGSLQAATFTLSSRPEIRATVDEVNVVNVNLAVLPGTTEQFAITGVVTQSDTNIPVMKLTMATSLRTGLWRGLRLDRTLNRNDTTGFPEGRINKPSDIDQIRVWYDANSNGKLDVTDTGSGVDQIAQNTFENISSKSFPYSPLAQDIDASATVIKVMDIAAFFPAFNEFPKAPGKLILDDDGDPSKLEIVTYTGVDTAQNMFTGVSRGQDKTTAKAHAAGGTVSGQARIMIVSALYNGQEITQIPKNYFVTFDLSPTCTVDPAARIGAEMATTSYFLITGPDYMGNTLNNVGLHPPRGGGGVYLGAEPVSCGWTESFVSNVKEYRDLVTVESTNTIALDRLVQGALDFPVAQFIMETDISEALWYGIRIYSTGTATFGATNTQQNVPKVRVWRDSNNDGIFAKSPVNPYSYTGIEHDIFLGDGVFGNTGTGNLAQIVFSTDKVQQIITESRAEDAMISQRYFVTFDIADNAMPADPATGEPRTLGIYLTADSFPTDEDQVAEATDFISETNKLDRTKFPWFSQLRRIVSSPRTVFIKSTPVFSEDIVKPSGNLLTYESPRLKTDLTAFDSQDILLYSNDPLAQSQNDATLALPASGYAMLDNEIIKYTGLNPVNNALTGITRGVLGSFAVIHSSGSVLGTQISQGTINFSVQKLEAWCDGFQVEWGTMTMTRLAPAGTGLNGADIDVDSIKIYRDDNGSGRLERTAIEGFKGIVTADTLVGMGRFGLNGNGNQTPGQATIWLNDPALNRGYVIIKTTPTVYFVTYNISPAANFSHPLISNQNQMTAGEVTDASRIQVTHPSDTLMHRISTYVPAGLGTVPSFPVKTPMMPIVPTIDTLQVTPVDVRQVKVERTQQNAAMVKLQARTDKNAVIWERLKVGLTGTGVDADITNVKVWKVIISSDEYNVFDNTATVNNEACGLMTYGGDIFSDKAVDMQFRVEPKYKDIKTIGTSARSFYITYDINQFAGIGRNVGVQLAGVSYFTVVVPDEVYSPYSMPFITQPVPIEEVIATVNTKMSDSVYWVHAASGTYQSQANVEMLRLKLATDKSNAVWEALTVKKTGTGGPQDQLNPEGRNSDVKYIKVFRDANMNNTLDADDQCISEAETRASSFVVNGIYYSFVDPQTMAFDILIDSIVTPTGAFPESGPQLLLKLGDEICKYSIAGTTNTYSGGILYRRAYLRVTERGVYGTSKVAHNAGETVRKMDMFDLSNNLSKTKMIYLTNPQVLNPSGQAYFIAYDIGDNAIAGNSVGVEISDRNYLKMQVLQVAHIISPDIVIESASGILLETAAFYKCKSGLLPITPISLIVRSDNLAPSSSRQNTANVPLMAVRLRTNRNHASISQLNITQTGTVENPPSWGKGQGDFSVISIWREATSALYPSGDGRFDSATDILIASVTHSVPLAPNPNFVNGLAKISLGSSGLHISTAEVKLYVVANIGAVDLANTPTENDTAGIKFLGFGDITLTPQTSVSENANSFPYASGALKILNQNSVIPLPYAPIPAIWANPFNDGYPAMDTNGDGLPDREYRISTSRTALKASGYVPPGQEVYLDFNGDNVNDLQDLNGDGISAELDLTNDGLMAVDLNNDGKLDLDFNHDGIADAILADSNGDGIPEIDLGSDGVSDDYVPLYWTNSRVKLDLAWYPTEGAAKYMVSIGKGPSETDVSVSKTWIETNDTRCTMSGVSLDELKWTTLTGDFLETVDASPASQATLYVENLAGFNTGTGGYIYVGTGKNAEIMHYSNGGSEGSGTNLRYKFNIDQRACLGTNKQTHLSGATVSNAFYYVKIKAKNSQGMPGPSVLSSIYRVDVNVPGCPANIMKETTPKDYYKSYVKILWNISNDDLSGVHAYEIQESMDTDPRWNQVAALPFTTLSLTLERDIGHYYYYRIRSQDYAGNWSAWSQSVKVTTGRTNEVISQLSNFPNPAKVRLNNEKTYITYMLNQDARAAITVFDLIGEKVFEYNAQPGELWSGTGLPQVDGKGKGGTAGANVIPWDGRNSAGNIVATGAYICLVEIYSDRGVIKSQRKIGIR